MKYSDDAMCRRGSMIHSAMHTPAEKNRPDDCSVMTNSPASMPARVSQVRSGAPEGSRKARASARATHGTIDHDSHGGYGNGQAANAITTGTTPIASASPRDAPKRRTAAVVEPAALATSKIVSHC